VTRIAGWVIVLLLGATAALAVRTWAGDASTTVVQDPVTLPPTERVRVEILNGGGVRGQAGLATTIARDAGFDVVYFGNAASFDHVGSEVVDRVGRPDLARAVAAALGIDEVRDEPDPDRYVDVTVVLGSAWRAEPATDSSSAGEVGP